jgi:hypothetical protein
MQSLYLFVMWVAVACLDTTAYWVRGTALLSLCGDYSVLELLHIVVGDLANISGAHAASIFRVEIYRLVSCCVRLALCLEQEWERGGKSGRVVACLGRLEQWGGKVV